MHFKYNHNAKMCSDEKNYSSSDKYTAVYPNL